MAKGIHTEQAFGAEIEAHMLAHDYLGPTTDDSWRCEMIPGLFDRAVGAAGGSRRQLPVVAHYWLFDGHLMGRARRGLARREDCETARFTIALGPQHPADAVPTVDQFEAELMEDEP